MSWMGPSSWCLNMAGQSTVHRLEKNEIENGENDQKTTGAPSRRATYRKKNLATYQDMCGENLMGDLQLPLKIEASSCNLLSRFETDDGEKEENLKVMAFKNSRSWGKDPRMEVSWIAHAVTNNE
mmetsp:Transcript_78936/g.173125  ORF Transcript_78936/g.173125 Transcript_78936/m.173125 type:complete len:125 (+) Transcript_78936:61-435(+)